MNWDNINWDNFSCVDMSRRIKDEISTELNAMTPGERHQYFERINQEIQKEFPNLKYANQVC
jgi:fido (protein-threonine AMPylation protein)